MRSLFVVSIDPQLLKIISDLTNGKEFQLETKRCVDSPERLFSLLTVSFPAIIVVDCVNFTSPQETLNFLERIRNRHPKAKVILAGGNYSGSWVSRFFRSGAWDWLVKPVKIDEMKQCLVKAIASLEEEDSKEKNARLEKQIQRLKPAMATGAVYDFIFSTIRNAKEIWERTKILGLPSNPNLAMVLSIDDYARITANKSESLKLSLRREVYQAVQVSLKSVPGTLTAILGNDSIVILCSQEEHHESWKIKQEAFELAEHIKSEVEKKIDFSVTIGIGNFYNDARNLHLSYSEAIRAQRHKFFSGDNQVIHIEDVEPIPRNTVMLPLDQEPQLLGLVRTGDARGAQKCLLELMDTLFGNSGIPPELLKIQILELLIVLGKAAIEGGADSKKILPLQFKYASELFKIETSESLKVWLSEITDDLIHTLLLSRNERNLRVVRQAIGYIEANYSSDLSLKDVADHVYLSPNYFSQIFKQETGSTFVEYLTHHRIQKAKELLLQIDYSVSEVSRTVGYPDPRYFSRVFKAVVGVSPSNFKHYS